MAAQTTNTDMLALPDQSSMKPFDISADRQALSESFAGSLEMEEMTSEITVDDLTSIVTFGADAAKDVSRASDVVLKNVSNSSLDTAGGMLKTLAAVMAKVDEKELGTKTKLPWKIWGRQQPLSLDAVLEKYQQLGAEVDSIYIKLRSYEKEILAASEQLEDMLKANISYYHRLAKYIMAGEQGIREIQAYLLQFQEEYARTHDPSLQFTLTNLNQASLMLERRIHDLRLAENVALQAIPMIQMVQFSNLDLARKINSAFIVTLPAFRQALAHAIIQKRQSLQAEAISALEARTRAMMEEAAATARIDAAQAARAAEGSPLSLPELRESITDGIRQTQQLLADTGKERLMEREKLRSAIDTKDRLVSNPS